MGGPLAFNLWGPPPPAPKSGSVSNKNKRISPILFFFNLQHANIQEFHKET